MSSINRLCFENMTKPMLPPGTEVQTSQHKVGPNQLKLSQGPS